MGAVRFWFVASSQHCGRARWRRRSLWLWGGWRRAFAFLPVRIAPARLAWPIGLATAAGQTACRSVVRHTRPACHGPHQAWAVKYSKARQTTVEWWFPPARRFPTNRAPGILWLIPECAAALNNRLCGAGCALRYRLFVGRVSWTLSQ